MAFVWNWKRLCWELLLIVFITAPFIGSLPVVSNGGLLKQRFNLAKKWWIDSNCQFPSPELYSNDGVLNAMGPDFRLNLKACDDDVDYLGFTSTVCRTFFNVSVLLCTELSTINVSPIIKQYLQQSSLDNVLRLKGSQRLCEDTKILYESRNLTVLKPVFMSQKACQLCEADRSVQHVCDVLFSSVVNYLDAVDGGQPSNGGATNTGTGGVAAAAAAGGEARPGTNAAQDGAGGPGGGVEREEPAATNTANERQGAPGAGSTNVSGGDAQPSLAGSATADNSAAMSAGSSASPGNVPVVAGNSLTGMGGSENPPAVPGNNPVADSNLPSLSQDNNGSQDQEPVGGLGRNQELSAANNAPPAANNAPPAANNAPPAANNAPPAANNDPPAANNAPPAANNAPPAANNALPAANNAPPAASNAPPAANNAPPAANNALPAANNAPPAANNALPAVNNPAANNALGSQPDVNADALPSVYTNADGANVPPPDLNSPNAPQPGLGGANVPQPGLGGANGLQPNLYGTNAPQPDANNMKGPLPPFNGANVPQPNPFGANAPQPDLSGANVLQPNPYGANAHQPDLSGANVPQPNPYSANAPQPDLSGASVPQSGDSAANPAEGLGGAVPGEGYALAGGVREGGAGLPFFTGGPGGGTGSSSTILRPDGGLLEEEEDFEEEEEMGDEDDNKFWETVDQNKELLSGGLGQGGAAPEEKPHVHNAPQIPPDGVQLVNSNAVQTTFEEEPSPSGHFMAYFITAVVLCVAGYVIYHNKQKIFAIALEGRRDTTRRRGGSGSEGSSAKYSKLQTSVEEVVPSLEKSTSSKNYIY